MALFDGVAGRVTALSGGLPPGQFTAYAPEVFRKLRAQAGVSDAQYLECLTSVNPRAIRGGQWATFTQQAAMLEMASNSKSGAFFFCPGPPGAFTGP